MKRPFHTLFILLCVVASACNGQTTKAERKSAEKTLPVGGGCDGCELMYIDMPEHISETDTSAGWNEPGQRLIVSGIAYRKDGKTPAPNVVIYYWHTNNNGIYEPTDDMTEVAKRHGHLRGWVKTDENGRYAIYTIRPATYPDHSEPAHIHISIKESDVANEYYTDELVFHDDPLLTDQKRKKLENRGGSGILTVTTVDGVQTATHDFILGRNIPHYPD